mgnify:CR=1 FL=1
MTTFGWIIISSLSLVVVYLLYNLIQEILVNRKLNKFKGRVTGASTKVTQVLLYKKAYQVVLAAMLVFTLSISGVFREGVILESQKLMTQAHQVGSKSKLLALLQQNKDQYDYILTPEAGMEDALDGANGDESSRDFIDTNVQVEGVDEADIIKTDGNYIYYASRYYSKINVVLVNEDYEVEVLESIDLGDVYTENMYLTEDYIVVIGYTYNYFPIDYTEGDMMIGWYYQAPTGTVAVIDRDTYDVVYEVETDAYFFDHRMIDDVMYLVSTKYLYNTEDELRPSFIETKDGFSEETFVDYDDIYYYEDVLSNSMTVITSIDLADFSYDAEAFLGNVNHIYANQESLYTTFSYYNYDQEENTGSYQSLIMKFDLNMEDRDITYQGAQSILGYVQDSYWMDEYEGYLRVVTTEFWPAINRLYVLEEDPSEDVLNIVATIDEGLGLENENVKSVRFNQDLAQVVTFEQTDPLYTIDLSDPENPEIMENPIKEEGYSTYMHVWNEDYYLIGFGFDATADGRITGLKLSAYDTRLEEPLETYSFASDGGGFNYSFSEAIYNPKALMIDATKGIVGFPMSMYHYDEFNYYYESSFVLFFIDFESDNIISEPIFISHDQTDYYMQVDRGVYIENIVNDVVTDRYIYTFSYEQVLVYHIETDTIIQKETLNEAVNAYID